jgi:hypothetical protein
VAAIGKSVGAICDATGYPLVGFVCERCGSSLGIYGVLRKPDGLRLDPDHARPDPRGEIDTPAGPLIDPRPYRWQAHERIRGRIYEERHDGVRRYRWACRCGREGKRRADRLAELPANERDGSPSIVVVI